MIKAILQAVIYVIYISSLFCSLGFILSIIPFREQKQRRTKARNEHYRYIFLIKKKKEKLKERKRNIKMSLKTVKSYSLKSF